MHHFKNFDFPSYKGSMAIAVTEKREEFTYGVLIPNHKITPRNSFVMFVKFENNVTDPREVIHSIEKWDGQGGHGGITFKSK